MKGWFSLVFKRVKRVKILDKKGFEADVEIPLYIDGNMEDMSKVKKNMMKLL